MARQKYGYAESSALRTTNWGGHNLNAIDEANILENGMLVKLGADVDVENRLAETPAETDEVYLVLDVILPYDESTTVGQAEYFHYPHEVGEPTRVYELFKNDRFAIADYMVTAPLAGEGKPCVVGNYLVTDGNRKYEEVAADGFDPAQYGFAAVIQEITYKSNLTLYRLRVVKNKTVELDDSLEGKE